MSSVDGDRHKGDFRDFRIGPASILYALEQTMSSICRNAAGTDPSKVTSLMLSDYCCGRRLKVTSQGQDGLCRVCKLLPELPPLCYTFFQHQYLFLLHHCIFADL